MSVSPLEPRVEAGRQPILLLGVRLPGARNAAPGSTGATVQTVALVVSPGMRRLESSAPMAEWRTQQATRHPDIKLVIHPVEGLGVPGISNQAEDDRVPMLEASAKGVLVALRSSTLEVSKALAAKAIARLP